MPKKVNIRRHFTFRLLKRIFMQFNQHLVIIFIFSNNIRRISIDVLAMEELVVSTGVIIFVTLRKKPLFKFYFSLLETPKMVSGITFQSILMCVSGVY